MLPTGSPHSRTSLCGREKASSTTKKFEEKYTCTTLSGRRCFRNRNTISWPGSKWIIAGACGQGINSTCGCRFMIAQTPKPVQLWLGVPNTTSISTSRMEREASRTEGANSKTGCIIVARIWPCQTTVVSTMMVEAGSGNRVQIAGRRAVVLFMTTERI